jgi:hypothetical protein
VRSDFSQHVNCAKIYRETMNRLSSLQNRVNEGKDLDFALEFCRYVFWSGVIELLEYHASTASGLEVSGANLRTRVKQLQQDIQDRFRKSNTSPKIELSELEKINHKLDLIAGRISQFHPPTKTEELGAGHTPELQVIQGGAI